jgi:hypothetical protein
MVNWQTARQGLPIRSSRFSLEQLSHGRLGETIAVRGAGIALHFAKRRLSRDRCYLMRGAADLGKSSRDEARFPFLRFELLDECSEMRGNGSREGTIAVLTALPNC